MSLFEHLSASAFGSDRNGSDATPCSEADRADISSVHPARRERPRQGRFVDPWLAEAVLMGWEKPSSLT